ncbi:MAG: helix-turn-helix domain-containing protein [Pirellulales bacterium]
MDVKLSLKLTDAEISAPFSSSFWAERFPPVLTLKQAAELLQVPKATLYDWRSRGMLGKCSRKVGKHVRIYRDRLIKIIFNEGLEQ